LLTFSIGFVGNRTVTVTDELLANNAAYAASFTGPLPLPPAKQVAVLACMDARINVYGVLGLNEGAAHVIRNAGGVVTDDEFKAGIQKEVGIKPAWSAEAFGDLDEDVRQSIARIQASPFVPHKDRVRGFVYEVETGKLREVS
jgi:carbonic anhydrase